MKTSSSLLLIGFTGIAAFLLGNRISGTGSDARPETPAETLRRPRPGMNSSSGGSTRNHSKSGAAKLSAEKAALLSPAERSALLNQAALLSDPARQAEILCGLLAAMTRDEIAEATKTLLQIQTRGNTWSQDVWNQLWTQWGKVDPEACLALSAEGRGLNTYNDYRHFMSGWLETNPAAALAWAKQSAHNSREAEAAAFAITSTAKGDIKQMEAAIIDGSRSDQVTKACLQDYFDLAISSGDKPSIAAAYDEIAPALRAAAWPVVMQRLTYTDPREAASWLEAHANDPGRDYGVARRLVDRMTMEDPAGTTAWAAGLPLLNDAGISQSQHPAAVAISRWIVLDPAAAQAWVQTRPADTPWLAPFLPRPASDPFAK